MHGQKLLSLLLVSCLAAGVLSGAPQQTKKRFPYNSDEAKVGPYTLEDPLSFADGCKVLTPADWRERRSEILQIFEREMYGRIPEPAPVYVEQLDGGRRRMWFRPDRSGPKIDWLVLYPEGSVGPMPSIIMLNFSGNHSIREDPLVNVPVDSILARGYAFVTAWYGDVSPDPEDVERQQDLAWSGVFDLWPDAGKPDGPRSLGAWAWALMRGMDMIEADPALDASRVLLTGCSRLGKAALVAGAWDERFAAVVLNQTGGGGVPLAKRDFGEHVLSETSRFTHWFSPAYAKYAGCEAATMPFDQHMLVSCIAPRPLLVEGFDNPWFDTHGEFLCLQAASPVWEFFGVPGLPPVPWPDFYDTSAIGPCLGYVRRDREAGHGIAPVDWGWMLDFADCNLRH